jgi:hypothetical protein
MARFRLHYTYFDQYYVDSLPGSLPTVCRGHYYTMRSNRSNSRRRATWLAFALVALAVCCPVVHAGWSDKQAKELQVPNEDTVR